MKMLSKRQRRAAAFQHHLRTRESREYKRSLSWTIRANLSSSHPDYGMTHAEHARRKAGLR
jgi:hypothetical protein